MMKKVLYLFALFVVIFLLFLGNYFFENTVHNFIVNMVNLINYYSSNSDALDN